MDPLISIIIPVYKVEKYLDACVESVVSQTYSNLEIILIDDESPDRCGEMCDVWAAKDSRIRVVHQKNVGAYAARNAGLAIAQGEFIGFADPDDELSPKLFEYLYRNIQQYEADVSVCSYLSFSEAATTEQMQERLQYAAEREYPITVLNAEDELSQPLFLRYTTDIWCLWRQLFRRSSVLFGNEWFDPKIRSGGDHLFILQHATDCRRVVRSDCPLYAYRLVSESDSRRYDPNRVRMSIYVVEQWVQYLRRSGKQNLIEKYEIYLSQQYLELIWSCYKSFRAILHYQVQIRKEVEFRQKIYEEMRRCSVKNRILSWVTFDSPLYFSVLFFKTKDVLSRCKRSIKRGIHSIRSSISGGESDRPKNISQ